MMTGMRRAEGQLSDYDLPRSSAEEPFGRTALHTTSDSTFEQYNSATSHTIMGFSSELLKASITVYNRLPVGLHNAGVFPRFNGSAK